MKLRARFKRKAGEDEVSAFGRFSGLVKLAALVSAAIGTFLTLGYFLGVDVRPFLSGDVGPVGTDAEQAAAEDQAGRLVAVVMGDTEGVWAQVFRDQLGDRYRPPKLVTYSGSTRAPCAKGAGGTGAFYCPSDSRIYMDTAFFSLLESRLAVGGDFATELVVAHVVAHHVQNEMGMLARAERTRARVSRAEARHLTLIVELQADCFAGIWAHHARDRIGELEPVDIEEAMEMALRIEGESLRRAPGRVHAPHSFDHGEPEQRHRWFTVGYRSGDMNRCNTFGAGRL